MTDEPRLSPQGQMVKMLADRLEQAKAGKLQSVMIGFVTTEGAAGVESSPMSPIMLNHLSFLLQRRVSGAYDRAARSEGPGAPPVGKVPSTAAGAKVIPKVDNNLPRKTRRQIAKQINKASKKAPQNSQASPANGSSVPAALKPQ